jgi:hypothetical protein
VTAVTHTWWYVARASGLVAWALALGSILLGLALASRALGKRPTGPWLLDLHRWVGGLTIWFTAVHVGALVADSYVRFDLVDVLVPFASTWRPAAVAWGVISLWLLVAIELTSYARAHLSKRVWHGVHLTSYAVAVMATIHGVTAGSDAANPTAAWVALGTLAVATFFVLYRKVAPPKPARVIPPRSPRSPAVTAPATPSPGTPPTPPDRAAPQPR